MRFCLLLLLYLMCFIIVSFRNFRALNFRWNFSILMNKCFDFTCCRDGKTPLIWRIFYNNRPVVVFDLFALTYSTYSQLRMYSFLFSRQIFLILVYISLPLNCATRAIRENHTELNFCRCFFDRPRFFSNLVLFDTVLWSWNHLSKIRTEWIDPGLTQPFWR